MNVQISFVKGNEENLEDILGLLEELLKFHQEIDADFNLSPNYLSIYRRRLAMELKDSKDNFYLIVYSNNRPIGFGCGKKIYSPTMFQEEYKGYIPYLYVNSLFRRQGLATKILSELEQWFKENNLNIIEVDVMAENEKAVNFYNQIEYKATSKRLRKQMGELDCHKNFSQQKNMEE